MTRTIQPDSRSVDEIYEYINKAFDQINCTDLGDEYNEGVKAELENLGKD